MTQIASLGRTVEKFDRLARGYSSHDYADPSRYARRRAKVAVELGPPLPAGARVVDLGCADGNMAAPMLERGFAYRGVDASAGMIAEARSRVTAEAAAFEVADFEHYEPDEPVDLTLCFRAVVYAGERQAFFERVAGYTRTKFVFDFNPRTQRRSEIEADLAGAGFTATVFQPFLLPQLVAPPAPLRASLLGLEQVPALAALALRVRGIWICAASR
jgi:SAM-dependent methyltransferase